MSHESQQPLFLFPPLPLASRLLICDFAELLAVTDDLYVRHFDTEIRLCRDAARGRSFPNRVEGGGRCRILPFQHRHEK